MAGTRGTWNGPVATTTWLAVNSSSTVVMRYPPSRSVRDVTLAFSLTGRSNAETYDSRYAAISSFDGYMSLDEGNGIPGSPLYCDGVNSLRESHRDLHGCPISGPASRITKLRSRLAR